MLLREKLMNVQNAMGVTDRAFAERLSTSAGYWCNVRQGKREMSRHFLRAVLEWFPDFEDEVIQYIKGADQDTDSTQDQDEDLVGESTDNLRDLVTAG